MSDQAQTASAVEADDISEDLRSAIGELKLPAETPEARVVLDKPDPARDNEGKFAPKPADERKVISLPDKTGANANVPLVPTPEVTTTASIKAPTGLKAEFQAKFGELSPDWQAEITRREAAAAKEVARQDEERMFGKKISEIVLPYLPTIRQEGGTAEKAVQDLLQTAHTLRQGNDFQKAQSVAMVMQQFKVSPQALFSILQGGNGNTGGVPSQGQVHPQLNALERQVADLTGQLQGINQQRQLQEEHSLQSQIEEFSSKPGHEHFDRVRIPMGVLLENGIAEDLEDAYNRAIYADPEIRSTLLSGLSAQGQRLTEQSAKTDAARRAAVSITGAPGSARPLNGSGGSLGSIEDDLRAAMREHSSRV